ncbi:MAG: multiheme c-type cytochrome [bacterium]
MTPRTIHSTAPALLAAALFAGCSASEAQRSAPTLEDAREFFAAQPRFLRPLPHSEVPEGLVDLRAESCGACHVEIYDEWRVSTHAHAYLDDAQFLEELRKTKAQPGRDASWICMNCHTPNESQLPKLVAALSGGDRGRPVYVDNPNFDPELQLEAVTCATCHVRDGVVLGPYGAKGAPHPVRKSDELLGVELCTQCHQAEESLADVELICVFDTGVAYAASPYPAEGKTCQSCHMPEVERPLTSLAGFPVRRTRRHWFGGSLIPKKPELEAEMAPLRAAYPNGADIEWVDLPASIPAGTRVALTFSITNANAGHTLPTSDVERFIIVAARALDSKGRVLAERSERFGTRYEWQPRPKRLDDTRLAPRETRTFELEFAAPAKGLVKLRLEGESHRISRENMEYHDLEGKTVPSRVFFEETTSLAIATVSRG